MKKILFVCMLLLLCLTTAMAQEPAICGDWVGVYESTTAHPTEDRLIPADWKLYLRIKKYEEQYVVMMKKRIADESHPFIYETSCKIHSADEKEITWITYDEDDYDTSPTFKEQGIPVGHIHDTVYCKVNLKLGVLYYSDEIVRTFYDKQGRLINARYMGGIIKKCTLYKENSDW